MDISNETSQAPQPVNSTPTPVNNSRNSKFVPIILAVTAAIVIAIGAYTLGTKQSQPVVQNTVQTTPIPSPTPDSTANWKTYAHTASGYSIKYPSDIIVDVSPTDDYVSFDKQIDIYVSKNNPENCGGGCPVIEATENIRIGSLDFIKIKGYVGAVGGSVPQTYIKYVLEKDTTFYIFTVNELKNDANLPPNRKLSNVPMEKIRLLEQMLSTFKITP